MFIKRGWPNTFGNIVYYIPWVTSPTLIINTEWHDALYYDNVSSYIAQPKYIILLICGYNFRSVII